MTDGFLRDATRLGSTLASVANEQLEAVLNELRRPADGVKLADVDAPADKRLDAATLAAALLQVVNKVGAVLVEVSRYDLVRRSELTFRVGATNPVSTFLIESNAKANYEFWVDNETSSKVSVRAKLGDEPAVVDPELSAVQRSERRRASVAIPANAKGPLVLEAIVAGTEQVLAQRTVILDSAKTTVADSARR